MMHKAWSRIEEVPYCFSRAYTKLQGHTALKSSNLTQSDRNSSLTNGYEMMQKLEVA